MTKEFNKKYFDIDEVKYYLEEFYEMLESGVSVKDINNMIKLDQEILNIKLHAEYLLRLTNNKFMEKASSSLNHLNKEANEEDLNSYAETVALDYYNDSKIQTESDINNVYEKKLALTLIQKGMSVKDFSEEFE